MIFDLNSDSLHPSGYLVSMMKSSQTALITLCFYRDVQILDKFSIDISVTRTLL